MKKFGIIVSLIFALFNDSFSQCGTPGNYCFENTTITACTGVLYDDGGPGAIYSDTDYIMTICPDNPGDVIQLDFSAFALQTSPNAANSDYLSFFDGNSTAAASLGDYTANSLQGSQVTGTINNLTGCLTLVFSANAADNISSPGFEAVISCTTPCANPTSSFELTSPIVQPFPDGFLPLCVGEEITLSDNGSFAEPGFTLDQYIWSFGNGTNLSTTDGTANYTYSEPGEYFISLAVLDNNGCSSLNIEPLRVIVATIPQFPDLETTNTEFCLGEEIVLHAGEIINPTWSSLPPSVVSDLTYLADGAGFSYTSSITFDFFDEDAVFDDCGDLDEIMVNMEHSYIGDLGIQITCPDGTTVELVTYIPGIDGGSGGGVYLGEPIDDDSQDPGIGYNYSWSPEATNGNWAANIAANTYVNLPAGTYQSTEDLCGLVGCPLNGTWSFTVTDNLFSDNGTIFEWGILFSPDLYPEATIFTPSVGTDADSSYWSGPGISYLDGFHDDITISLTDPGIYEYVYEVVNNFGCSYDTTIVVEIEQSPFITAGPDLTFNCDPLQLQGGFDGLPTPLCTVSEGNYTYCYGENENYIVTYCPDTPGDGYSAVEITFNAGTTENFFDEFIVYDGDNTSAPVLAGPLFGDLSGMVFTATNSTGCLTIQLTSDGSVSCASGNQTEWNFDVGCASPYQYVWSWSPSDGLNPSDSPVTTIENMFGTTTYTLSGYPVGHPECFVTDDVTITLENNISLELEESYFACRDSVIVIGPPTIIGGSSPFDYTWIGSDGSTFNTPFISVEASDLIEYCVTVIDNCGAIAEICTNASTYPEIPASFSVQNSFGCEPLGVLMVSDYVEYQNVESMIWHYEDGNAESLMGSSNHMYINEGTYLPWLEIIDENGCVYYDTIASPVLVFPTPFAVFNVNPDEAILPSTTFDFVNLSIDASEYVYTFDIHGFGYSADTSFTFPEETTGVYNVELWTTNQYGCVDSTMRQAVVRDDIDIYIPNTFTPDGDGINDVWLIKGKGFTDLNYKMLVFNRWGDIVFESSNPDEAWTGGFQNGDYFVQDGLYFYLAEIQDIENDVKYTYEGHVLIVR